MAVTPDGTKAYVTNSSDVWVSVITVANGAVVTLGVGGFPYTLALTPDGTRLTSPPTAGTSSR